ncbi:MAG: hypothetical protein ACOYIF_02335 [Acetivibrionales bacterium]
MKALFISLGISTVLYGVFSYIAVLSKRPILCSNVFSVFFLVGLAIRGFFVEGASAIYESIFILFALLLFSLILFLTSGLKYSLGIDMDRLKKELVSLKFTPEGQRKGHKYQRFFASNGTKVIAKQYSHNKFVDISIVNGLRLKRINTIRTAMLPIIKKYTANTNFKLNSIMFVLFGLVFITIYIFI